MALVHIPTGVALSLHSGSVLLLCVSAGLIVAIPSVCILIKKPFISRQFGLDFARIMQISKPWKKKKTS